MVIKSLTITEDAYNRLKAMKMGNESFSEVITELVNNNKTKKMKNLKEVYGLLEGNKEHDKVWRDTLKKGWNKWNKKYA